MNAHEIAKGLDKSVQRACYKIIEKEYILDDIKGLVDEGVDVSQEKLERMAEMFIDDYDANISHFDQIEQMVQKHIK